MVPLYNNEGLNPSAAFYEGKQSALRYISHEIGHVLGLSHEDAHPNFRSMTHVVYSSSALGCPADPYVGNDFPKGTVVPAEGGSVIPDFGSIMEYGAVNCQSGSLRFYKNSDNTPVNYFAGDTGAISAGDFATVRAIYSPSYLLGSYWSTASSIKTEYIVAGPTKTQIETSIGNNIRTALNSWLINLDPSIGAISKIGSGTWVYPPANYSGPTIRVGVDLTEHSQDFSISCNPSNPKNYCLIMLYDATNASGDHLLTNNTYLRNVLQAAFGVALGLSAGDPNSAVYHYNDLSAKDLFPTRKDLDGLRKIYNSSAINYAPLIRLNFSQVANGVLPYQYVTSWEDARLKSQGLQSLTILGRVPLFGGTVAGSAPGTNSSFLNVGLFSAMNTPTFNALWGKSSIGSLAAAVPTTTCPQEAKDKASAIVSKGTLGNAAIFATSQSFAPVALTAYWDNSGHWVMAQGRVGGASCQFTVGYISN